MTGSRGSGGFSFDHSLVSRAVGTMFDAEILDRCHSFDPWEGAEYEECELDKRVRGGRMDTSGLGDVKVGGGGGEVPMEAANGGGLRSPLGTQTRLWGPSLRCGSGRARASSQSLGANRGGGGKAASLRGTAPT
jgi:hypothetical protein